MKELYYRLLGRRKYLLKAVLITSLILLVSFITVLLPQLVSPHILSTHLDGLTGGNVEIDQEERLILDIELYGSSYDPSFIEEFNQTIETASVKVYGMYKPKDQGLVAITSAYNLNETYGKYNNTHVAMIGLSTKLFESVRAYSNTSSPSAEVLLLTDQMNETFNWFNVSINNINTTITYDDVISIEKFQEQFPYIGKIILSSITTNYGNNNISIAPCFLYQIDEYLTRFDPLIQNQYDYMLKGFICFEKEQQEIMSWSIDAKTKIAKFEEEIRKLVESSSTSTWLEFMNVHLSADEILITIVYSFIRGLQITFWGLGIILTCMIFAKVQVRNKEKEQRALIAGQSWAKRIGNLVGESILIGVSGAGVALSIFYPLVKLQTIFSIDLTINLRTMFEIGIITLVGIVMIFIVYLDFERYLRRTLIKPEDNYKLFKTIPKYLYPIPLLLVFLLVWILNRNVISLAMFAALIIFTGIIGVMASYLQKAILWIGEHVSEKRKRKQKKPLTSLDVLLKLWEKKLFSRLLLFSMLISIVSGVFIYANLGADGQKTSLLWMNGGEIEITGTNLNTSYVEQELKAIHEITEFVRVLKINNFINETDSYNLRLIENTIKPLNSATIGERIGGIYAINSTAYVAYYESWGMKNWVTPGQLAEVEADSCFVSKNIQQIGFEKDDTIQLFNTSKTMTIKGYINNLPVIGKAEGAGLVFIMDYELLHQILVEYECEFFIKYQLRCEEEDIETTIEKLAPLLESSGIDSIDYMNPNITTGVRIVFIRPMIIIFQLFLLVWGITYLYGNIDDSNQSNEAKNLGIIAFAGNYRKTLRNFKMLEGCLLYSTFLMIFGILYGLSYFFMPLIGFTDWFQWVIISKETWVNLIFLLLAYPMVLLMQGMAEYRKYRAINLSVIYRHPE